MTRYTVFNQETWILAHASVEDAARAILEYGRGRFEVRQEPTRGFAIWRDLKCRGVWSQTSLYSPKDDRESAEAELFANVVGRSYRDGWDVYAIPDEDHRESMQKQIADLGRRDDDDLEDREHRENLENLLKEWEDAK